MNALLKSLCFALVLTPLAALAAPEVPTPAPMTTPSVPTMPAKPMAPSTPAMPAAVSAMDINSADASQLESLPGIGPTKAKAIVDYRTQHGAFQNTADLEKVPGIGPKTMEQLTPLIRVNPSMPTAPSAPIVK